MRVLIFEPQFVGHNLTYVRYLTERLFAMGCEVHLVTSRQATESEEFESHLGGLLADLHVHRSEAFRSRQGSSGIRTNGPLAALSTLNSLHWGLREVIPDHVYFPFGNPIAHWLSFPSPAMHWMKQRGIESELVLLFGKYAYPHTDFRARWKERFALAVLSRGPWTRVHHIVPHAVEIFRRHRSRLSSIAHLLPDPVDRAPAISRPMARRRLGLPTEGRCVGLVGLIDSRKGADRLLEAFESSLPRLQGSDRLLLAGKMSPEIRTLVGQRYLPLVEAGRIHCLDRHLSQEELWAACIASNLIATPYPHHLYSASIVIRAAQIGVPVLANSIGWMKETVDRFSLGNTCDTCSPTSFSEQLVDSLDNSADFRLMEPARRFVAFHSTLNFADLLTARLSERMGQVASPSRIPWEQVLRGPSMANFAVA